MNHTETNDALKKWVERYHGIQLHKYEAHYAHLDYYVARDGKVIGLIEAKTRDHDFGTFPTTVVDLIKWQSCVYHETQLGLPCWVYFGWTCGTVARWRPADAHLPRVELMTPQAEVSNSRGRVRPVVHVELSDLQVLSRAAVSVGES